MDIFDGTSPLTARSLHFVVARSSSSFPFSAGHTRRTPRNLTQYIPTGYNRDMGRFIIARALTYIA